jgi:hypothetical protein
MQLVQTTNSGKKLLLDVTTSLNKCPPPKLFGQETHTERKILKRNRVVYYKDHPLYGQPRPEGSKPQDITNKQVSLAKHGYDYTIEPPEVIPDPERIDWFIGLSGWTWDKTLDNEGVSDFIYDVIYGGNALDIRKRKNKTNILPPAAIRKGNTEKGLTAETISAITNNEIDREDEDNLMDFICEIAADKSLSMQQNIFNAVRKEVPKLDDRIYLWHSQGTGDHSFAYAAKKYDIPYGGDIDPSGKGRLGYIADNGGGHGMWMNGIKHFTDNEGTKPVLFTGTHGSLKQGTIDKPRVKWDEDFEARHKVVSKFVKLVAGVYDETDEASKVLCKTIEENMEKSFLRSNDGHCHLPQKREAYAPNGGGAREITMVNKLGESKK